MEVYLDVKNFGPISKGEINIKPLTVFVGPNGAGKSYTARLYYAILTALLMAHMRTNALRANIERVFASRITNLIKWGSASMEVSATITGRGLEAACRISTKADGRVVEQLHASKATNVSAYYLPASRAGLLQSYRAIISALMRQIPFALLEGGFDAPDIAGVEADFLATITSMRPTANAGSDAIKFFEEELVEGELVLKLSEGAKIPELSYRTKEGVVPLRRMPSSVAELAPLGAYLKYGALKRGDVLIIEEPEAHLHPDRQAKVAELLAMLVNKLGLNVLVITHSDVLLAKLSNLVALGSIPEEEARERGLNPELAIDRDKIAVYSFRRDEEGVVVEEVNVTERGIPDDVFRKVIEELYEESMDLYYSQKMAR